MREDARNSGEVRKALALVDGFEIVWPSQSECQSALDQFAKLCLSYGRGRRRRPNWKISLNHVSCRALPEAAWALRRRLHSPCMEPLRLVLFTTLWTAIWAAPLPKLSRRVELAAGLIPFAAFGLRVFGTCFVGVPADDPVRMAVAPLVDWINGASGTMPFQWVLDVTVAIGLVWLASIANIPRRWRLATIWVMPAVALASLALRV